MNHCCFYNTSDCHLVKYAIIYTPSLPLTPQRCGTGVISLRSSQASASSTRPALELYWQPGNATATPLPPPPSTTPANQTGEPTPPPSSPTTNSTSNTTSSGGGAGGGAGDAQQQQQQLGTRVLVQTGLNVKTLDSTVALYNGTEDAIISTQYLAAYNQKREHGVDRSGVAAPFFACAGSNSLGIQPPSLTTLPPSFLRQSDLLPSC